MSIQSFLRTSILCCTLLLTGCLWWGSESQTISFDGFSVDIPVEFTTIAHGLVENKQIINKVLHAYTIKNEDGFDTNLIITKSLLPAELDYEQFRTVNTNKLKQYVQGYTPGEKEIIRMSCPSQDITGLYVTFAVQESIMQNWATYYMAQLQFVTDKQGYILSYATATKKEQDDMKKIFKNIVCTL